jgi:hypothetical protein
MVSQPFHDASMMPATPITASLGRFVTRLRYVDVPEQGVTRAKASILDAVGCALAGSVSEEAAPVRDMVLADGGAPVAQLFGHAMRVPPAAAALANATAGHALDYDDSSPPMIGHPSVSLPHCLRWPRRRQACDHRLCRRTGCRCALAAISITACRRLVPLPHWERWHRDGLPTCSV